MPDDIYDDVDGTYERQRSYNGIAKVLVTDTSGNAINVATTDVVGTGKSATFTPAAASHTAGDCNGAAATFADVRVGAGEWMITSVSMRITSASAEATAWRLHLYNVTPTSAIADDAAWDYATADLTQYLGYVDILDTSTDIGTNQWTERNSVNKQITVTSTGDIFGYLQNLTTVTPAAVAHVVTLHGVPV